MKKTLTFVLTLVLLISVFPVFNAFATDDACYLSDDLSTLHYSGHDYLRTNLNRFYYDDYYVNNVEPALPDSIRAQVSECVLRVDKEGIIIILSINFKDGSEYFAKYLRSDWQDTYKSVTQGRGESFYLEYGTYNEKELPLSVEQLYGEKTELDTSSLYMGNELYVYTNELYVYTKTENGELVHQRGIIFEVKNEYYFVDCSELSPVPNTSYNVWEDYDSLPAYKITDEEVAKDLKAAFSDEMFNFFGGADINTSGIVCTIICSLIFGLIPFITLALAIVLMIRTKGYYRKLFAIIGGLSLLELIVFVILAIVFIVP